MKKVIILMSCIGFLFILQNCSTAKNASKTVLPLSFNTDIMPILKSSCTPCHFPPEGRKEPLNNYEAVKKHFTDILLRVRLPQTDEKFMPFKKKKPALSDSLINVLVQWEKQEMPQ